MFISRSVSLFHPLTLIIKIRKSRSSEGTYPLLPLLFIIFPLFHLIEISVVILEWNSILFSLKFACDCVRYSLQCESGISNTGRKERLLLETIIFASLGKPYHAFSVHKGGLQERWREAFSCSDRKSATITRCKGRIRLEIRKKLIMMRVVRQWNRLPGEMVDAPDLEVTGKLEMDGLKGLFKPQKFCVSLCFYLQPRPGLLCPCHHCCVCCTEYKWVKAQLQ